MSLITALGFSALRSSSSSLGLYAEFVHNGIDREGRKSVTLRPIQMNQLNHVLSSPSTRGPPFGICRRQTSSAGKPLADIDMEYVYFVFNACLVVTVVDMVGKSVIVTTRALATKALAA